MKRALVFLLVFLGHISAFAQDNSKLTELKFPDPRTKYRFIEQTEKRTYQKGLDRRYIAVWQSHGKYFSDALEKWIWQRPNLNTTIEDIYTQSYVLPFLIPMLENAGAYVITPRERDINSYETIADNDPSFTLGRDLPGMRQAGSYHENGIWKDCGAGFADSCAFLGGDFNPFTAGTARETACSPNSNGTAAAIWELDFPHKGHYAVYISYKSLENSSSCAHYCVLHAGGRSDFLVNQKICGGTWVYLGSFDFEGRGIVVLDNAVSAARKQEPGCVVTADAVKVGGGVGKVAKSGSSSAVPAFMEGAKYNLQWSGFSKSVWGGEKSEYINDYACRPYWVKALKDEYGLPVDMAFAFHTDAGVAPQGTTVGTLTLCSLEHEGSRTFSSGLNRGAGLELCETVQEEVIGEIRRNWNPEWALRGVRDKGYWETCKGDVPSMILELLSHQNFEDMKYGLDPEFRFDVCRAIYKGILKYFSSLHDCDYAVQPLPVKNLSALWTGKDKLKLSWSASVDPAEPSSVPIGYILYTRTDSGAFDSGREIFKNSIIVDVPAGHVYSFKVEAWNDGGKSFPSEILAAGRPVSETGEGVLVVNNFTRLSGPSWFENEYYAGFDVHKDAGVPYLYDISYAGEVYDFSRESRWVSGYWPGMGASGSEYDTVVIAGNSYDYVSKHGQALMKLGRRFCSSSEEAFYGNWSGAGIVDLICGKQFSSLVPRQGKIRFPVFSHHMMKELDIFSARGGNIIISGSRIASDLSGKGYVSERLGYVLENDEAGIDGKVGDFEYFCTPNDSCYFVESADAIIPASDKGRVLMRYGQGFLPAVVSYNAGNYKVVSFGFPLEILKSPEGLEKMLGLALREF